MAITKTPSLLEQAAQKGLSSEQTREYFTNQGKTFAKGAENELARLKAMYAPAPIGTTGAGSTGASGSAGMGSAYNQNPSPASSGATGGSIFDLYGVPKGTQPTDPYAMYGLTTATYTAPNTTEYDTILREQLNPAAKEQAIQAELAKQEQAIRASYGLERNRLQQQTENERKSQLSNLYSIGYVNPASSGVSSIGSASDTILAERIAAANAAEQAALASASDKAYGRSDALSKDRYSAAESFRSDVEKKAKDQYDFDRQKVSDAVSMANNVVNAWKSGQEVSRQAKQDAKGNVEYLINTFGSKAFDGMTDGQIDELEVAIGFPVGSLRKSVATLKEQEKAKKADELQFVPGTARQKAGYFNKTTGVFTPLDGVSTGGTGAGGGSNSKIFTEADKLRKDLASGALDWGQAWNRLKAQFPTANNATLDDALGGDAGYDTKTGQFDPAQATGFAKGGAIQNVKYTSTQLGKLRAAGIDPTDTAKADVYLFGPKKPSSILPTTTKGSTSILNRSTP